MKIEKEKLRFTNFTLTSADQGGLITLGSSQESFKLTPLQYSYLDVLKNNLSLEDLVQFFLGQGWLVNFRELYALMQFLVVKNIILNPEVLEYFKQTHSNDLPIIFSSLDMMTGTAVTSINPAELPFFRSLEPAVAKYLLQDVERFQVPAQIRLTHAGQTDRDLFILLKGQASIYKVLDKNHRQMVATLGSGALFGERGFLLNQPRNADIITSAPSEILRIRHRPEFDTFIKTDKAQSLQHRFWVMQALLSSEFFKELPSDTLDALVFSGRLVQAPAHQTLFQEGQPGNTCYILVQGAAVVSKQGRTINVMKQGACFGEISLLASGGVRTASVTTQLDSILLEIQQNNFYKILSQNLILAKEIETLAAARLQRDATR